MRIRQPVTAAWLAAARTLSVTALCALLLTADAPLRRCTGEDTAASAPLAVGSSVGEIDGTAAEPAPAVDPAAIDADSPPAPAPPDNGSAPADPGPPPPVSSATPATEPQDTNAPQDPNAPLPNRGVLPSTDVADPDAPPNPREILGEYGIDESRFREFADGHPLTDSETEFESLLRVLYRLRGISAFSMEHWATDARDLSVQLTQPDRFRGDVFHITGRVVMIERVKLAAELKERLEATRLYRCHLYVGDPELPAVLYTHHVPKQLAVGDPLDDRISFRGLLLKRGPGSVGVAPLVFAANRLAWHSDTLLGDLDADCGLHANIQNGLPLRPEETECFYQTLAAANDAGNGELVRHAYNDVIHRLRDWNQESLDIERRLKELTESKDAGPAAESAQEIASLKNRQRLLKARMDHSRKHAVHDFVPLMETPSQFVGQLRMFFGTARRIVRVRVTDPDVVGRFGITHYYQIDMLVNLEHKIKLVKPAGKEDPEVLDVEKITWTHPATFCAISIPEGMPTGDKVHEPIRIAGFFFKNWAYETSQMEDGYAKRRSAPMLIGREPHWDYKPQSGVSVYAGAIAGGLFVVALTGIWIGVWRLGRGDDKFRHVMVAKAYGVDDNTNLNNLGIEAEGMDFGFLDGVELHHGDEETDHPATEPADAAGGPHVGSPSDLSSKAGF